MNNDLMYWQLERLSDSLDSDIESLRVEVEELRAEVAELKAKMAILENIEAVNDKLFGQIASLLAAAKGKGNDDH